MSTSGSKSNEHVAHFLVDIHSLASILLFILSVLNLPYTTGMEKDKEELFKWEKNLF